MDQDLSDIIGKLQEKAKRRRDCAVSNAEAEYQDDLKSIARLTSLNGDEFSENFSPASPIRPIVLANSVDRPVGPAAATREAVEALPDGFSIREVDEFVRSHHPSVKFGRVSLFSALNKLKKQFEIEVLAEGQGKFRPTTYRKITRKAEDSHMRF